ncbi:hypothetical protein ACHAXT_008662 [Thalassiosira profunda]
MAAPDEFRRSLLRGLHDAALRGSGTDLEVLIPRRGNDAAEPSTAQFNLHYPIVAASSAYLAANPEPKSGRVIADVDPEAFAACVEFMYTGEFQLPSTNPETSPNVTSVLDAANILQIDALRERCLACLGIHHLDNSGERFDHPSNRELAVEPAGLGEDALRNSLAHMAAQLKADLLVDDNGDGRAALATFCDNLMSLNPGVDEMLPGDGRGEENEVVGTSSSAINQVEEVRPTRQLKDEFTLFGDDTVATSASIEQENAAIDASSDPTSVDSSSRKRQKRCEGGNEHEQPDSINVLGRVVTPPRCVEEVTQQDDWNGEEKKEEEAPPVNRSVVFVAPSTREEQEAILWRTFGGAEAVPGASLPEHVANRSAMVAGGFGATVGVEPENANYSSAPALCTEQAPADTAKAGDTDAKDAQTEEKAAPKDTEEGKRTGSTTSRLSVAMNKVRSIQAQIDELEAAKVGRPKHIRQQLKKKLKKLREQLDKVEMAPNVESQPSIVVAAAASSVDASPASPPDATDKRESNAPSIETKKQTKDASSKKHEALDAYSNTVESKANEPRVDDVAAPEAAANATPKEESEKERMNLLLREEREKAAAAKAKKKSKRSKKHDKWLQEQEAEKSKRKDDWQGKIDKEREGVYLISHLIASELLLQNDENEKVSVLSRSLVLADPQAAVVIDAKSEDAHTVLYGGLSCRVKVAGLDRKGLNGRQGTLRYWDASNAVFSVGLDTKKGPNSDVHAFKPEYLDPMPLQRQSNGGNTLAEEYDVEIVNLRLGNGESVGCQFTVDKSMVTSLRFARSIDEGLVALRIARDYEEREQLIHEKREWKESEEECRHEEADRKRRQKLKDEAKAEAKRQKEERKAKWQRERDGWVTAKRKEIEAVRDKERGQLERELERIQMQMTFTRNLEKVVEETGMEFEVYVEEFVELYEEKFDYEFDAKDDLFFVQRRREFAELDREFKQNKFDDEEEDGDDSCDGASDSGSENESRIDFIANLQGECWRAEEINHSDKDNETVKEELKRVHFIANLQGECWRAEDVSVGGSDGERVEGEQRRAHVDFVATMQGDCWKADEHP